MKEQISFKIKKINEISYYKFKSIDFGESNYNELSDIIKKKYFKNISDPKNIELIFKNDSGITIIKNNEQWKFLYASGIINQWVRKNELKLEFQIENESDENIKENNYDKLESQILEKLPKQFYKDFIKYNSQTSDQFNQYFFEKFKTTGQNNDNENTGQKNDNENTGQNNDNENTGQNNENENENEKIIKKIKEIITSNEDTNEIINNSSNEEAKENSEINLDSKIFEEKFLKETFSSEIIPKQNVKGEIQEIVDKDGNFKKLDENYYKEGIESINQSIYESIEL